MSKRKFFSGNSVRQAVVSAASHFDLPPDEVAYREVDKKHGFLKMRKRVIIEVDADDPRTPPVEIPAIEPEPGDRARGGGRAKSGKGGGGSKGRSGKGGGGSRSGHDYEQQPPPDYDDGGGRRPTAAKADGADDDRGNRGGGKGRSGGDRKGGGRSDDGGGRGKGGGRDQQRSKGRGGRSGQGDGSQRNKGRDDRAGKGSGRGDKRGKGGDSGRQESKGDDSRGQRKQGRGRSGGDRGKGGGERRSSKSGGRDSGGRKEGRGGQEIVDLPERSKSTSERYREEATGKMADGCREALERVLDVAGIDIDYKVFEGEDRFEVDLAGPDEELLVAEGGDLLRAVEHLVPRAMRGVVGDSTLVRVNCGDFHEIHEERLRSQAQQVAADVRKSNKPSRMEPMSPADRRIVHVTLADEPGVSTNSDGNGHYKQVVVKPA